MAKFFASNLGHLVLGVVLLGVAFVAQQPWALPYHGLLVDLEAFLGASGAAVLPQVSSGK